MGARVYMWVQERHISKAQVWAYTNNFIALSIAPFASFDIISPPFEYLHLCYIVVVRQTGFGDVPFYYYGSLICNILYKEEGLAFALERWANSMLHCMPHGLIPSHNNGHLMLKDVRAKGNLATTEGATVAKSWAETKSRLESMIGITVSVHT
jgi:hypothetical protein